MSARDGAAVVIRRQVNDSTVLLERVGIVPEVFERVALNALVANPNLATCQDWSLNRAVMQCIEIGLMPDGRQAAIVPFKDRNSGKKIATLIPMIDGRLALARRATKGISFRVRVVYRGDEWEYREGLDAKLHHVPNPDADRSPKSIIAAYAVAHLPKAARPEWEVFFRGDIERYRAMSLARTGGPWASHYAEMAKKAVLGQLLKRLPKVEGDIFDDDRYGYVDDERAAQSEVIEIDIPQEALEAPEPTPAPTAKPKKAAPASAQQAEPSQQAAKAKAKPAPPSAATKQVKNQPEDDLAEAPF